MPDALTEVREALERARQHAQTDGLQFQLNDALARLKEVEEDAAKYAVTCDTLWNEAMPDLLATDRRIYNRISLLHDKRMKSALLRLRGGGR